MKKLLYKINDKLEQHPKLTKFLIIVKNSIVVLSFLIVILIIIGFFVSCSLNNKKDSDYVQTQPLTYCEVNIEGVNVKNSYQNDLTGYYALTLGDIFSNNRVTILKSYCDIVTGGNTFINQSRMYELTNNDKPLNPYLFTKFSYLNVNALSTQSSITYSYSGTSYRLDNFTKIYFTYFGQRLFIDFVKQVDTNLWFNFNCVYVIKSALNVTDYYVTEPKNCVLFTDYDPITSDMFTTYRNAVNSKLSTNDFEVNDYCIVSYNAVDSSTYPNSYIESLLWSIYGNMDTNGTIWQTGYNVGFAEGTNYAETTYYNAGYNQGYDDASRGLGLGNNPFRLIGNAFSSIASILSIEILPNFTIGLLVFTPLIITLIVVVVKIFRG